MEVIETAHSPIFLCQCRRSRRALLRLRQNTSVSLAHRSRDFAAVGTRGERDARGMAKTFELACVRVCFDIDCSETFSEPHRCRHGFPGLAERRQSDTLLSPEIRKGCSLYTVDIVHLP